MNRRSVLKTVGLALAATALSPFNSLAQTSSNLGKKNKKIDASLSKRKLGASLEVSSIGLGVQNMSRTYQTTIPTRSEMHNIIRIAFDNGVTFFDAAEAYNRMI